MNIQENISKYTCSMHPEIISDEPGKCPKCGGMDLVPVGDIQYSGEHSQHDHASMMASPEAAKDFIQRFFIVSVILVPLALLSEPVVKFLNIEDFLIRPYIEFILATVIFYFGLIFFRHAKHEIMMKQYGMMTLVSLGVGAGYLFSVASTFIPAIKTEFYLEIATLIWVLLFGHYLEAKSSTAAGNALEEVAKLLPKKSHKIFSEGIQDVELEKLVEGDLVLIKHGEKVPADGEIVKGESNFNESHISGESKPVQRKIGDAVVAGAISIDGTIEVKLKRVGESSTIGQIKSLISEARKTKPSAQRLADKAARWLTFTALGASIITLIIWSFLVNQPFITAATLAITVLVIACPHALGLAIPTVSTIGTQLAVKNGIFVKDMKKIEIIKKADYVVFDKTGTLTKGKFGVSSVNVFLGQEKDFLAIAGSIEEQSSHVIGYSIVKYVKEKKVGLSQVNQVKNISGRGITAKFNGEKYILGNQKLMEENNLWSKNIIKKINNLSLNAKTLVYLSNEQEVLGVIALSDQIKQESKETVSNLHRLGIKVAMLTGDNTAVAKEVASELGIDDVFAEVLPEDKYEYIKTLQDRGNVVLMTGDGVNDAPALTQADAGVAIGAGTDVAVEAGDIVLTKSNPEHIVRLIILARKVYSKMIQNLWWALGYNILAIPAAAGVFVPLGFKLSPAAGALAMSLSSVVVVINALSLRKTRLII